MPAFRFELNENLYVRDPQETDYGQKLLKASVELMNETGFESFTFKKLADKISSVEASVYRYFENKHKLLLYLTNWYWEFIIFSLEMPKMMGLDAQTRFNMAIDTMIENKMKAGTKNAIDRALLQKLVREEATKAYHVSTVDEENKLDLFKGYEKLVSEISEIILELKPEYEFPKSLASSIIELINHQLFFAEHMPALTDVKNGADKNAQISKFIHSFVNHALQSESVAV